MDPCPFVRLTVGNLALKVPVAAKAARTVIHPTTSPCFCKIKLKGFPIQTAYIPSENNSPDGNHHHHPQTTFITAATFHLSKDDLNKLAGKSIFAGKLVLKISIFTGKTGATCGLKNSGRLLGKLCVPLELKGAESKAVIFHNGWISVGKESQFHVNVRADPDPRFVFQFDGEPECSPLVFQIKGNIRQPVFTCNFSFRTTSSHHHHRSRSSEQGSGRGWLSSFGSERERTGKERKGWSVTVHDLSGSPVAAASMVTPFVASPGSDRVSRSNPGSWLILRPGEGTWKPWGRLEAWRERGAHDGLGYRFELIPDMSANSGVGVVLAESTLNTAKGGTFSIDLGCNHFNNNHNGSGSNRGSQRSCSSSSPGCSPRRGSGDIGMGFVMAARVEGEGKCSKPTVEVSVQHVTCTEDAAAYVALAAAVDLSIDACRLFSQKLRKELCHTNDLGS
ncbi:hypothetical protein SOVF_189030 [Spinacia oleracea]|uniref:Formin-like protein 18 n=1 Tax=Spinacia oleracea TaxID=3562 RepID=A0A9R0J3D0_SPIOL|nr:uncharacterized protein LOC110799659 [Spinacia oleracea]KNA05582.1 hypothetical protein SOVF_189030 [Spinacia oleracea]